MVDKTFSNKWDYLWKFWPGLTYLFSAHEAVRKYFSGPEAKVVVDIASMASSDFEVGVNGDPDVDLDAHNYQVRYDIIMVDFMIIRR